MKAKGMAGVATATHDDAFFGANNPAAAAFAGNRIDLGADLFRPIREASNSGMGTAESGSNYFIVPEFGYNRMVNTNLALGVTVYGNGGMNTDYSMNLLGGAGSLGVDLMQLIVAPTVAYKVNADHSFGISPLLGYQRFKAEGLSGFAAFTSSAANLTNNGYDDAFGYGVRVGYMGKIAPTVTIGAAYASKMNFEEFDMYSGLFAEQGDFDIPENYNVGVAWQATPQVKLALDYQRINYNDVASVGNPVTNLLVLGNPLGSSNGPGFGWDNVDVWKLGVEYKYSPKLTLRAGYSHADNPINGSDMGEAMFNILAPAVIENHATLGFTYMLASGNEVTMSYMHAFENEVSGARPGFGGGTDTIKMYQNSLGIQYSWKM
jgi:long-chain fatty acid transport protein